MFPRVDINHLQSKDSNDDAKVDSIVSTVPAAKVLASEFIIEVNAKLLAELANKDIVEPTSEDAT